MFTKATCYQGNPSLMFESLPIFHHIRGPQYQKMSLLEELKKVEKYLLQILLKGVENNIKDH